jgi:DNA polymerase
MQLSIFAGTNAGKYNTHALSTTDVESFIESMRLDPCRACGTLLQDDALPVVCRGSANAKIMAFGQGPGIDESVSGKAFSGRSGYFLVNILKRANFDPDYDLFMTNVCMCYFNTNEPPNQVVDNCQPNYAKLIDLIKPKLILAMGLVSTRTLCDLPQQTKFSNVVGKWQKSIYNIDTFPIYHPAFLLRKEGKRYEKLTESHLEEFRKRAIEVGIDLKGWNWGNAKSNLNRRLRITDLPVDEPETDQIITHET